MTEKTVYNPLGKIELYKGFRLFIKRVLDNLFSNALKFYPTNSQIIGELNLLKNQNIEIKLIDFGETIFDDKKELIFEKYHIGSDVKGIQQIGLGLAFCKIAIEEHHGTIKVENNPQSGNIFIIQFNSRNLLN